MSVTVKTSLPKLNDNGEYTIGVKFIQVPDDEEVGHSHSCDGVVYVKDKTAALARAARSRMIDLLRFWDFCGLNLGEMAESWYNAEKTG